MSITPAENVVYLEHVLARARLGAGPVATAMAKYIADRTATDMLQRHFHGPQEYHRARGNRPPSYGSGTLSKGMEFRPAHDGIRSTALVRNRVEYARILEFGCVITPKHNRYMHWVDTAGSWYHEFLEVHPHPFLGPTTDEAINDGGLRDAAIAAFEPYDP